MEHLNQALYEIDWKHIVLALFVLASVIILLVETWKKIKNIFGIEFSWQRKRREDHELLIATTELVRKTAENLEKLQTRHTRDEEEFRNNLNNYIEESRKDRKALHDEMSKFTLNRANDREQSLLIQKELKNSIEDRDTKIENLIRMFVDKEIDDMRFKILDFASSVSSGKKFNRESYDHILRVYRKYEQILEEHNMENGLVEESIKYIQNSYQEHLRNGDLGY